MKFEDRSHEETERQQRCARSKAWNLPKNKNKLKEKDKAAFYFPAEEWVLPAASAREPEERKFVVDSGAILHVFRKKDLNSAEFGDHEDIKKSDDGWCLFSSVLTFFHVSTLAVDRARQWPADLLRLLRPTRSGRHGNDLASHIPQQSQGCA